MPYPNRSTAACVLIGTLIGTTVVVACTGDRPPAQSEAHAHEHTETIAQSLSAAQFFGTSLPAKTLALTFDDGPGTRTIELSQYLKSQNIRATFFVNGARVAATALPNPNGLTVTPNAAAILAQLVADGHLVANHTTTHRDLATEVPDGQRVQELADTDAIIAPYAPANRLVFRAPYGSYNNAVFATLSGSAMNKYVGPIYWEEGGLSNGYPNAAADWACWQGQLQLSGGGGKVNLVPGSPGYATTQQCGDAYVKEIDATGKGIVLMHDPYSWAQGSTVDMVKYIVPILVGKGYAFVRIDKVPAIAAALPCDATCATCTGPEPNECASCDATRYLAGGSCVPCSACPSGKYVASACAGATDTVCAACDTACAACTGPTPADCGTCATGYYAGGGAGGCTACTVCPAGTFASAACTPTTNATCAACPAGTYASAAGATQCKACGSCDDGDPCTEDRCDATAGCAHRAIAGCTKPPADAGPTPDAGTPATPSPDGGKIDDPLGDQNAAPSDGESGCSVARGPGSVGDGTFALALAAIALVARSRRDSRDRRDPRAPRDPRDSRTTA